MKILKRHLLENCKRRGQNFYKKYLQISYQIFVWFRQSPPMYEFLDRFRIAWLRYRSIDFWGASKSSASFSHLNLWSKTSYILSKVSYFKIWKCNYTPYRPKKLWFLWSFLMAVSTTRIPLKSVENIIS